MIEGIEFVIIQILSIVIKIRSLWMLRLHQILRSCIFLRACPKECATITCPIRMSDSRRDRMVSKLRFKAARDCDISDIKILDYDQ